MRPITVVTIKTDKKTYRWQSGDSELISVETTLAEGKTASSVSVSINDPFLETFNEMPNPQKKTRIPIEVWYGFGQSLFKVFSGYLSSLEPSGLPARLKIQAVDKAKGLRRVSKGRNLTNSSAAALILKFAKAANFKTNFSAAPELDQLTWGSYVQAGESDWDVITKICEDTGHSFYVRGDTLFVKELGSNPTNEVLKIAYGPELVNGFNFRIDELRRSTTPNVFDQKGGLVFQNLDIDQEAALVATRLANTGLVLQNEDSPSFTEQSIQRALKAQAKSKKLFKGTLTLSQAYPEVDVDWQFFLTGMGPKLSGAWNISEVSHNHLEGTTSLSVYNGGSNG